MNEKNKGQAFLAAPRDAVPEMLQDLVEPLNGSLPALTACRDRLRKLNSLGHSLLIIDVGDSLDHTLVILRASKRALPPPSVLVLVEHHDIAATIKTMKAGATSCLEKPIKQVDLRTMLDELLLTLRQRRTPSLDATLSAAELSVLRAILDGRTSREIAAASGRSRQTVEVHRQHIMSKLGASGIVDLVKRAALLGFWDP